MPSARRIWSYMRPYHWIFLLMMITTVLPVIMELVVPRALRYVIDSGISENDMAAIWQGSAVMLAAAIVGAIATLGQGVCRARISQGLAYDLRNELFAHINTFSFANLDTMQAGQLMTRMSSDVDMVRAFMSAGLSLLVRALLMITGSLVMMFLIDWQLALLMLVLLPLAAALIGGLMVLTRPMFTVVQEKLGLLNTAVQENLAGVQVVKAYVREHYEIDRFQLLNEAYMDRHIQVGRLLALAMPLLALLTNLGIVAVTWYGGLSVINQRLTLGELVAFNGYLLIGMAPILLLGNVLTMIARAEASADRIWEILDTAPALQTAADPYHGGAGCPADTPHHDDGVGAGPRTCPAKTPPPGRVSFENVSFQYEDADGAGQEGIQEAGRTTRYGGGSVLSEVSFDAAAGQRVAIVGATGSGKSSLVQLIPRFYDSASGRVLIDGVDVRDWDLEDLRRQIGVVQQETILFSGTIRDNIAYGRPDAALDDVKRAAKAAQAHDFIMAMPEGYDSHVEERGANLSGGQKQRLAIARALLVSPAILIMDDSTSAVDSDTEARIQAALENSNVGSTLFIVAQRISSVLHADQILVLDHGRIAARGTHHELLQSSPIYQEIYQSQLGDAPSAGGADEKEARA
ncbi:MAG: ABC transporter ATP-binding protein [Candidatus Promineifilaceae bacterium]